MKHSLFARAFRQVDNGVMGRTRDPMRTDFEKQADFQ